MWTKETGRKIISIGMRQSRGVTSHGFALNVDGDLDAVALGGRLRHARGRHDLREQGGLPGHAMDGSAAAVAAAFEASLDPWHGVDVRRPYGAAR